MIVSDPTGKEEVVTEAVPLSSVGAPRTVAPFVNVTVPVAPLGRVAVKVTGWPRVDGLRDEVREIVNPALFTI